MAKTPVGEIMEGAAPVRRSTRTRRAPASYAEAEGEDDLVLRGPLPPAGRGVSSSRCALKGTSSSSRRVRNRVQENPISDPDFGPKRGQRKRRRLDNVGISSSSGDISQEMSRELEMRKICTRLKIDFALFDNWPEDPAVAESARMRIPYLPNEIVYQIFENCRSEVLVNCQKSCARFRAILQDNPGYGLSFSLFYCLRWRLTPVFYVESGSKRGKNTILGFPMSSLLASMKRACSSLRWERIVTTVRSL